MPQNQISLHLTADLGGSNISSMECTEREKGDERMKVKNSLYTVLCLQIIGSHCIHDK